MAVYNNLIKDSIAKNIALETIEKARNLRLQLMASFQSLYNTITGKSVEVTKLQTTATNLQDAAQKRLNDTTKANPFMALVTLVFLVITAYKAWKSHTEELQKAEKKRYEELHQYETFQKEIYEKGKAAVDEYKEGIKSLINIINSEASSQETRKKAYESLIKIHPEFKDTLDSEYRSTAKLAEVYAELAKQIEFSAQVKARQAVKTRLMQEKYQLELDYAAGTTAREKEQEKRNQIRKNVKSSQSKNYFDTKFALDDIDFTEHNKGVAQLNEINKKDTLIKLASTDQETQLQELYAKLEKATSKKAKEIIQKQIDAAEDALGINQENTPKSNYKPLPEKEKKHKKTQYEKDLEAMLKSRDKYAEELHKLEAETEKRTVELMQDGFEKEKAQIQHEEKAKLVALKDEMAKNHKDIDKINGLIAQTKDKKLKARLEEELSILKNQNRQLTDQQLQEIAITNTKLLVLDEKYKNENFKKKEEAFNKEISLLERQKNEKFAFSLKEQKVFLQNIALGAENEDDGE